MLYGMPCYPQPPAQEPDTAFASQKNHIWFYVLQQGVMQAHRDLPKGAGLGKGCIRYSKPEKINFDVVRKILLDVGSSSSQICRTIRSNLNPIKTALLAQGTYIGPGERGL
jgi:hypothetical protein